MAVCNFKGGVAKTTTSIHLGQYLALKGYRVLMLDLDAQASLTQMFGILPHLEVESRNTVLPYLEGPKTAGEDWSGTLAGAVRKRIGTISISSPPISASTARNSRSPAVPLNAWISVLPSSQGRYRHGLIRLRCHRHRHGPCPVVREFQCAVRSRWLSPGAAAGHD